MCRRHYLSNNIQECKTDEDQKIAVNNLKFDAKLLS